MQWNFDLVKKQTCRCACFLETKYRTATYKSDLEMGVSLAVAPSVMLLCISTLLTLVMSIRRLGTNFLPNSAFPPSCKLEHLEQSNKTELKRFTIFIFLSFLMLCEYAIVVLFFFILFITFMFPAAL